MTLGQMSPTGRAGTVVRNDYEGDYAVGWDTAGCQPSIMHGQAFPSQMSTSAKENVMIVGHLLATACAQPEENIEYYYGECVSVIGDVKFHLGYLD